MSYVNTEGRPSTFIALWQTTKFWRRGSQKNLDFNSHTSELSEIKNAVKIRQLHIDQVPHDGTNFKPGCALVTAQKASDIDTVWFLDRIYESLKVDRKPTHSSAKQIQMQPTSLLDRLYLPPEKIANEKDKEEVSIRQVEQQQKQKEKYLGLMRKRFKKKVNSAYV